jgi:hypothetical protein
MSYFTTSLCHSSNKKCREGAPAYLAYVQAKPEVKSKLEDITILCHYPNVFAKATGLPPDQEIGFAIDLVPDSTNSQGTIPYSSYQIK